MPVAPGRSVAMLVEVAARNQLLRARGVHAARDFGRRARPAAGTRRRRASTTPTTATTSTAEASREARPAAAGDPPVARRLPGHHRPVRRGEVAGDPRRRGPGLLLRRQPAAGAAAGPARAAPRARRRWPASRSSSTSASGGSSRPSRRPSPGCAPPADVPPALIFLEASDRAAPALQRDPAAASAGARASRSATPSRSSGGRWPASGRWPTRSSTPPTSRCTSCGRSSSGCRAIRKTRATLVLTFESFGFKHGLPLGADLVFDVRFLPNPHFVPELRPQTGRDTAVAGVPQAAAGHRPAAHAADGASSSSCCRSTWRRARATSRWRSAAPAAAIGRSTSPRRCRRAIGRHQGRDRAGAPPRRRTGEGGAMIGVVVVTHGQLAAELRERRRDHRRRSAAHRRRCRSAGTRTCRTRAREIGDGDRRRSAARRAC